jgi:hypothetical protein
METRTLAALLLRIAGLIVIVSSLTGAAKTFGPMINPEVIAKLGLGWLFLAAAVSIVVPVLLGLVLIYFPSVTSHTLKIDASPPTDSEIAPLQRVAFAAIGLWLSLNAVLDTVYVFAKIRLYQRLVEDMPSYGRASALLPDDFATLVTAALQLVFGIWLLFGNRALANILGRFRS